MKTAIKKWGNSCGIRLNKNALEKSNLKEDDIVEIIVKENEIILRPFKKSHKTLFERFENYNEEYTPREIDWGEEEGKEVW